jgi:hypothetical protein
MIFVSIQTFDELVARIWLLRWFDDGSDDTALLLLLKSLNIRSVRMLDTIVCSEPLVWLFSPAWDAVIPWMLDSSALSRSLTLPIKEQQRELLQVK